MQKTGKNVKNGKNGSHGKKLRIQGSFKNGYVHVIGPATVTQIRRAVGIKASHTSNIRRAFEEAGVAV